MKLHKIRGFRIACISVLSFIGWGAPKMKPLPTSNYTLKQIHHKANIIPIAVIGGGPAGLSSAFYGAREKYHTVLFQGPHLGGQLMETKDVENWPGITKDQGSHIIKRLEKQAHDAGAIIVPEMIVDTDLSSWPFKLTTQKGTIVYALSLIIATGAQPKKLGIQGEETYWGKGVANCTLCDAPFTKGQDVFVVGGGDSSIEFALNLAPFAHSITLLVRGDDLDASPRMRKRLASHPSIKVEYNTTITQVLGDGKHMNQLEVVNTLTKKTRIINTHWLFLSIGQSPNVSFLKGQLPCDSTGCISMPQRTQETSIRGVFAAGRVSDTPYKTGIIASGEGLKAALDALAFLGDIGFEEQQEHIMAPLFYGVHKKPFEQKNASLVNIQEIENPLQVQEILKSTEKPIMLQLYSPQCTHCQAMEPTVIMVAKQCKNKVKVMRADINKMPALLNTYSVTGIPTFILFKQGKEVARASGEMSKAKLAAFVS